MSNTSIFRRHRDLFWSLLIAVILTILAIFGLISLPEIPLVTLITVFFGVLGGVGTLIIIFQKYERVIGRAKEKEMMHIIHQVFKYPLAAAVIGLGYLIVLTFVSIDLNSVFGREIARYFVIVSKTVLLFLALYAVLSLAEGISFVYRVMIGESGNGD